MAQTIDEPTTTSTVPHPLAQLSPDEMERACRILKESGAVDPGVRIAYCTLAEPSKSAVLDWDGGPMPRQAFVAMWDKVAKLTKTAIVSLDSEAVVEVTDRPGEHVQILIEEWFANADSIKADPGWQAAMARRGITEYELVQIDPWPASWFGLDVDVSGRRIARAVTYLREFVGDNAYAYPIENLVTIVDRDTGEVIEIQDGDVVPVPKLTGRYDADGFEDLRTVAPLDITQPDGAGFSVTDGHLVWGPWEMRISMHPIEGMVLHQIGFHDGGRLRPILYRASLSEMVVPYGSTAMNHWWKNAFDAGDIGLGKLVNSLTLGCDCLGEIVYLDSAVVDEDGNAMTTSQSICLHEEDYGILWKHYDMEADRAEVRRSRRMVVSFIATVGNYEYGFFWYFYLDGTIEAEVKLTGIIQTQAVNPGERDPHANPVTAELAGPHHQHLFNFRLDPCVDGPANSVYEVDAVAVPPGPDNPYANAFVAQSTLLESEAGAQRLAAAEKSRYWKIVNHGVTNAAGEPVGYKLMPRPSAPLLADETAAITQRAGFATKHLWVTAYDPEQRRAAGDFPNQHAGGAGLPAYVAGDRPVVDTDVVVWHTVGTTHFVRPEDWPVMPCDYTGFMLKPFGFFDRNPAIDLAPSTNGHCHS